jgi:hypothetical protein
VLLAKEHIKDPTVQRIAQWLVSDQSSAFYESAFNNFSGKYDKGRWDHPGGLAEATLIGYRAFRVLAKTGEALHTAYSVDRAAAIYLLVMISRAIDIRSGRQTTVDAEGSISTVAVSNALYFGMTDLTCGEIQALTKWWESRKGMMMTHEPFNVVWWVVSETMNWIFTVARKP